MKAAPCFLYPVVLLAFSVQAHGQVSSSIERTKTATTVIDYFGKERQILDANEDGWDDLWCAINSKIVHRDKKIDSDGDGLSDYMEMIMWRDPLVKSALPKQLTSAEVEQNRAQQFASIAMAQVEWEKKKLKLAPQIRQLIPMGQIEPDAKIREAEMQVEALRKDAAELALQQPAKDQALDDVSKKYKVPKEIQDENGEKLKLVGDLMGPVYIGSHDTVSAAGISADELWPQVSWWPYSESNTGLNLTGAGQTLGMWEVNGGVRISHQELGTTRFYQKDSAAIDLSGHATNVAGTMAGSGTWSLFQSFYESRGVAYEANVYAYNLTDFESERISAYIGSSFDSPVRVSNNSWGQYCGWKREDIDPTSGINVQWVWYGPIQANFQEDYRFGFYAPNFSDGTGSTQLDSFISNQAIRHLMIFSCGNDRSEGPGISPGTYYYRSGSSSWTSVNAETFPRDWSDGDDGFYDTIAPPSTAKNVLTVGACEDVYHTDSGATFLGFGLNPNVVPATFSGAGPTDDGRIKPDLVAVGTTNFGIRQSFGLTNASNAYLLAPTSSGDNAYTGSAIGTSFAAPAVTGALGLVQQRFSQLYPTLPASQSWRASTLKAIAINTCDDVGAEGPDYRMGYGLFNARKAVLSLNEDYAHGRGSLIKEFSLSVGASVSWIVQSNGVQPLAVTVPWSDPPGPALTTISAPDPQNPMLVNNIDMKVEYLGSDISVCSPPVPVSTYLPWTLNPDLTNKSAATRSLGATRSIDNRNNIEKVSIATPLAGRYRITVTHSGGLPGNPAPSTQVVSVALSGVTPEPARISDLALSPTSTELLLTFIADPGAYFTIQTSTDLLTWTDVGSVLAEQAMNSVLVNINSNETSRFWRVRRGQ